MSAERLPTGRAVTPQGRLGRVPPQAFFGVSAVFHYLGPSLAVLLFAHFEGLTHKIPLFQRHFHAYSRMLAIFTASLASYASCPCQPNAYRPGAR